MAAEEKKIGRQTPTKSYVLDYDRSLYMEAVELYERTGNKALPWQKGLLRDIMAVRTDGLWVHTKIGYSLPRRNGKTEDVFMREMWGLKRGERIAHTAHNANTAHDAWSKLKNYLYKAGYVEGEDIHTVKAKGSELIEMLDTGGVIKYRTRTGTGGLGEGFDLLIIDEAQEYTESQKSALVYTVSESANPQTIMLGTPLTKVSKGTIFPDFRKSCLAGKTKNALWAEWGVEAFSDPYDVSLWYLTNPSLGFHLSERKIEDEIGSDLDDFNIQRLGLWHRHSLSSAISRAAWDDCKADGLPDLTGQIFAAVKYGKSSGNVVLAVAAKTSDEKVFVEALDCRSVREGNDWILTILSNPAFGSVVIDGDGGAPLLIQQMEDLKLPPIRLRVADVVDANSQFETAVFQHDLVHMGQPSLTEVVSNSEHRAIGSNGGFGYTCQIQERDVTLMEAASLAYWLCKTAKPKKKRRVSY